jgi:hypothetical protein
MPLNPLLESLGPVDDRLEWLEPTIQALEQCRKAIQHVRQIFRVGHRYYWLANHTEFGTWAIVSQVQTRERWDREQLLANKDHKSIESWPAQVAAAFKAMGVSKAVTADGALVGPLCAEARKALGASHNRGGGGQGSGGKPRNGGKENGGRKDGNKGAKDGKKKRSRKTGDAGAAAPAAAAPPAGRPVASAVASG